MITKTKNIKTEQRNFFLKNGYLRVKDVYKKSDILLARKIFIDAFKNEVWKKKDYDSPDLINDIYRLFPELLDIIFNEKYFNAIKSILGDKFYFLPECSIHHNRKVDWHKDTTEQELGGELSHQNHEIYLLQVATYFQPNLEEGGLTIIPGTHRSKDNFLSMYSDNLPDRLIRKFKKKIHRSIFNQLDENKNAMDIPTESGDILIFDVRLDHRSTFLRHKKVKTKIGDKLAIFNTFGNDRYLTMRYLNFMKTRQTPYYQFLQNTPFPQSLFKMSEEHGGIILE